MNRTFFMVRGDENHVLFNKEYLMGSCGSCSGAAVSVCHDRVLQYSICR